MINHNSTGRASPTSDATTLTGTRNQPSRHVATTLEQMRTCQTASDDELEDLLRDAQKNARKIWIWEIFCHAARRPGITPLEKLANQLGAAILFDDKHSLWEVYGELVLLARKQRGPHRPAADDGLALEKMARMILHQGLTELAAAKEVATQMIKYKSPRRQHSYEATVERLRRKFRARRLELFRQARVSDALALTIEQGTSIGLAVGKSRPRKNQ
jgi:hypothetical protein